MAGGPVHGDADRAGEATDAVRRLPRAARGALLLGAAINVGIGVVIAFHPERSVDFDQVIGWSRTWIAGADPYAAGDSYADYPPQALVVLAPWALLPDGAALPAWVALNLLMAAASALLVAGFVPRGRRDRDVAAAAILLLPPFRTLVQFSLASFTAGVAGVRLAPRRPRVAGLLIGLSLIKPHIGGPAFLWALVARRWEAAAWALGTQVALVGVYLLHAPQSPLALAGRYAEALGRTQNRDDLVRGVTSLQPLVDGLSLPPLVLQAILAATLGAALVIVARRSRADADGGFRFFAAAGLASLLVFRHLSYNLLLGLPALIWLAAHPRRHFRLAGVGLGAVLAASLPTVWRVLADAGVSLPAGLALVAAHGYRAALSVLFLLLLAAPHGASRPRSAATGDTI